MLAEGEMTLMKSNKFNYLISETIACERATLISARANEQLVASIHQRRSSAIRADRRTRKKGRTSLVNQGVAIVPATVFMTIELDNCIRVSPPYGSSK